MEGGNTARQRVVVAADGAWADQLIPAVREAGHEVRVVADVASAVTPAEAGLADLFLLHFPRPARAPAVVAELAEAGDAAAPVLAVLEPEPGVREAVLEAGAEVLEPPFSSRELRLRVDRLLRYRSSYRRLEHRARELERAVDRRTAELEDARIQILERLATAAEYRDDETGEHTRRVGALAGALAEGLGVPAHEVELIRRAAPLHDVGKIGVPDGILLKPGRLTPKEIEVMQAHTTIGARMLSGTGIHLLNLSATIALTHHESWDGGGYPEGKSGEDIPLAGRIVAVADVFDALTTERPYKRAWSIEETVAELEAQRGLHLDPAVTDVALSMVRRGALPALIEAHVRSEPSWES